MAQIEMKTAEAMLYALADSKICFSGAYVLYSSSIDILNNVLTVFPIYMYMY